MTSLSTFAAPPAAPLAQSASPDTTPQAGGTSRIIPLSDFLRSTGSGLPVQSPTAGSSQSLQSPGQPPSDILRNLSLARAAVGALGVSGGLRAAGESGSLLGGLSSLAGIPTAILSQQPNAAKALQAASGLAGGIGQLSGTSLGNLVGLTDLAKTALPGFQAGETLANVPLLGNLPAFQQAPGTVGGALGVAGPLLGIGSGAFQLSQPGTLNKVLGGLDTAGGIASLAFPPAAPFVAAGSFLAHLLGGSGIFGKPSIFEARRKNVGPTAQAGESRLANALTQGVDATPGIQSTNELLAALGVPTPDTFAGRSNPVAVSLRLPPEISRQLGFPVIGPGTPAAFEFNPARLPQGSPFVVTPDMLNRFLGAAKQTPSLLEDIGGSGDVAFQDQAASEALASRVRADAQQAIRHFLASAPPAQAGGPSLARPTVDLSRVLALSGAHSVLPLLAARFGPATLPLLSRAA